MKAQKTILVGCLVAYVLVLASTGWLEPASPALSATAILRLRSAVAALLLLRDMAAWFSWEVVRLLPVAVLSAFVLARPEQDRRKTAHSFAKALALASACVALVLGMRTASDLREPFQWLAAVVAVPMGVWAGSSWQRGRRARLLLVPKLAGISALILAGLFALFFALALEAEPRLSEEPMLSSEQRRQLVRHFRGNDPRKIPPGEVRTIALPARELDQLIRWGALVAFHARSRATLRPGGIVVAAALPLSRIDRWLNVSASAQVRLSDGEFSFSDARLQLGRLPIPEAVAGKVFAIFLSKLQHDRDARRVLLGLKALTLGSEQASLSFGPLDIPEQLGARLMWGEDGIDDTRRAVQVYVTRLLEVLPNTAAGDARFAKALTDTFALARARSRASSAIVENRAALLALGIVLGHVKLIRILGDRLADDRVTLMVSLRSATTLRGRGDWARHFAVSCALTVISAVAPSDAAGMLKEEFDADGGSGFSFADLLADRSGTTLAELASRDEASAAAMEQRIAGGFLVDDFFPPADGLPEGIADGELQARYGGVGGARFRALISDIERRIAACSGYRN